MKFVNFHEAFIIRETPFNFPLKERHIYAAICPQKNLGLAWSRSSRQEVFCKKGVFRNFAKFTGKHLWISSIKKETLGQVFSCEFCKFSKNIYYFRTPPVVASVGAEIFGIARTTTEMETFSSSWTKIISRMVKQGGTISKIKQSVCKIFWLVLKYLDHFLQCVSTL